MASPISVLLVIDDPNFRGGLMVALRDRGVRVVLTGDGERANAFLQQEIVTLIVVDARIPGEGGVPWIRARREAGDTTPMVLCAATPEEAKALANLAQQLLISSVIPKGAAPDAIVTHLLQLLGPVEGPVVADAPVAGDEALGTLANAVEGMRQAFVSLQKNAERRERVHATVEMAEMLLSIAKPLAHEPAVTLASRTLEMLRAVEEGRLRLGPDAWVQLERMVQRAQQTLPPPTSGRATATPMAGTRTPGATLPPVARKTQPSSFMEVEARPASPATDANVDEL